MERCYFDENQPQGKMSLANLRNALRALHQLDLMPLRPRAKLVLDDLEYSLDASAQAIWSGTGVTVSISSAVYHVGSYALKAIIDGTGNRTLSKTQALILDAFTKIQIWEQCADANSSSLQFYLKDSSNNESYWDITTNATSGTWQQDEITLASPDSNNGSDADLSDITEWGFKGLDASKTYYFDKIQAIVGMTVAVEGTESGSFYKNVYIGKQPISKDSSPAPTITAPTSNPRIDILTINSSGTLAWVAGTEASSPSPDWSSLSDTVIPIALVYCKTTMTKVLDYEDKDTDTDQGYIYSDLRPFLRLGLTTFIALSDTPSSITANQYLKGASNGSSIIFASLDLTFLALTDTPSTFSGQALKQLRVNSGATALEFVAMAFTHLSDVPTSYSGKGGSLVAVNTGETALEFVSNNLTAQAGDVLQASADTERSAASSTYTKVKEIQVPRNGTYRVKFDHQGQDGATDYRGKARIYKNGVAFGTERITGLTYTTYSEDLEFSAGDLVQLYYARGTLGSTSNVKNFRIYESSGVDYSVNTN